jgi:YebC/PmpR family DNA-binding regulatory protein
LHSSWRLATAAETKALKLLGSGAKLIFSKASPPNSKLFEGLLEARTRTPCFQFAVTLRFEISARSLTSRQSEQLNMGRAFEYRKASKEARWGKMSRIFPKLAKSITMAAKEGGPDPDSNSKLRTAIMNAKAENMPKDNIDKAIKRASGKDVGEITEINYEGKGPHGCLIYVECATENTNRSYTNVRTIFNKNGGELVNGGSLEFMFDRKSVIEFNPQGINLEELELELMDADLEEMEVEGDMGLVYGDYTSFGKLTAVMEKHQVEVTKANLERVPNNPQKFSDSQLEEIDSLIDKLEDDEDVQAVFTNVDR